MAWRFVTANNKGGAGKTSTTIALAAALADGGYRVLAVDMDPQGNLTRRLGYDEETLVGRPTIADAVRLDEDGPCDAADVLLPCTWEHPLAQRIDLVPSMPPLLERRARESGQLGAVHRLRRTLDELDSGYDFTLVDIPPGLGHLTEMALAAVDRVVVVLMPEYDPVQGAVRMCHYVQENRDKLGRPDLRIAGVICTNVDPDVLNSRGLAGSATHRANLTNLPNLFGDLLWEPYVPHRLTWSGANDQAMPIQLVPGRVADELAATFSTHAERLIASVRELQPAKDTT